MRQYRPFKDSFRTLQRSGLVLLPWILWTALLFSPDGTATTCENWSEYKIALHTRAWIQGRVLQKTQGEDLYDAYEVEVLDSTDSAISGTVHVSAWNNCGDAGIAGEVYYMAIAGDRGTYALLDGVYNAMYRAPSIPSDGTASGGDFDWEVMCDTRLLVDRDGDISGAMRDKWLDRLHQGSPREAYYALNWLEQLREPNLDPLALATSVVRHFKRCAQPGAHDSHYHCLLLYQGAASAVIRMKHGQAAKLLADVFWKDQESLQVLRANSTDHWVVQLLLVPPSIDNINFLETLLGNRLETSEGLITAFAKVPGESVRTLLWRIIEYPEGYGVKDTRTLESVWRALAARNDPDLAPYLEATVLEPDVPVLGVPVKGEISGLKADAAKYCQVATQVQAQETNSVRLRELLEALNATDRRMREAALWDTGRLLGVEFGFIEDQPRALNDAALAACEAALQEQLRLAERQ